MKLPRALLISIVSLWLNSLHRVAPNRARRQALRIFCSPTKRSPPAPRHGPLLASAERRTMRLPGREENAVVTYRWSSPDADPAQVRPLVMLAHGWESCVGRLADWIGPLHAAGYDVVGVDAPAHGESEGGELTAIDYSRAMQMLASREPVAAVIGHSFGGLCAALAVGAVGLDAPLQAERLVLIAAPLSVQSLTHRYAQILSLRPALFEDVVSLIEERTGVALECFDAAKALAGASQSLLVVHDTRDEEVPYADGEALASALGHAELYTTTGLGHRQVARNSHVIRYVVQQLQQSKALQAQASA
ncbi:MAG: alpha/beta fold hydrolase [Pseudomonadota bacterium]